MTEQDKEWLVEWVWTRNMEYSKGYFEKMSVKELEHYYLEALGEAHE